MTVKFPHRSRRVTRQWLREQISSAIFIPLSLYVLVSFFVNVIMGDGREGVTAWLRSAPNGVMMILFFAVAFYYKSSWLTTIIEDYVHDRKMNRAGKLVVKALALLLAIAGISSVIKIMWGA